MKSGSILHIEWWLSDKKLKHVSIVPGGLLPLGSYTDPSGLVATHKVEGNLAQQGQVARRGAIAHAAVVFAECDVEHPVQCVSTAQCARTAGPRTDGSSGQLDRK